MPVTSIGSNAFAFASSLTSITIPKTVTRIGFNAFGSQLAPVIARRLTSVFYRGNAPVIHATGNGVYGGANDALVSYRFSGTFGWPAGGSAWSERMTAFTPFPATPPPPAAVAGVESATITSAASAIGDAPTRYVVTAGPGNASRTAGASGVCTIRGLAAAAMYAFTTGAYTADPTAARTSAPS